VINGKDIYVSVRDSDGTFYPVACDSSCTISLTRDPINVTGPADGLWRRIIPGNRISATVNGNGLISFDKHTSLYALQGLLIAGTLVYLMCEIDTLNGLITYECSGYVTKMELTGAFRAAGSFTYNIEIDGALLLSSSVVIGTESGKQNLLLIGDGTGELFDIDNTDNNLIE
jgi:predicted secreted protein